MRSHALLFAIVLLGCAPSVASSESARSPAISSLDPELTGRVGREQLESRPGFRAARSKVHADADAARALGKVPPGAVVRIFLGTWCSDSHRELSRFFDALDQLGSPPPFMIEYIAVDRSKSAPGGLADDVDLRFVPTFIVLRDGKELGRIVESAPGGIEHDLGALLRGERSGVLSGRSDL